MGARYGLAGLVVVACGGWPIAVGAQLAAATQDLIYNTARDAAEHYSECAILAGMARNRIPAHLRTVLVLKAEDALNEAAMVRMGLETLPALTMTQDALVDALVDGINDRVMAEMLERASLADIDAFQDAVVEQFAALSCEDIARAK